MIAFDLRLAWGRCVGMRLPTDDGELVELARDALPEEELRAAQGMAGKRRRSFLGGRLALREALSREGLACGAVLSGPRGAPAWPTGVTGSLSHKDSIAVALVATEDSATRGVDVELDLPRRKEIARHVLTDEEQAEMLALPEAEQVRALLVRFSIKESVYKAIDPFVQRYVGFKEVTVWPRDDGSVGVTARLRDGTFDVQGAWRVIDGCIVTAARATRSA